MDHLAAEAVDAGELGRVALVVAVVAAVHEEEAAGESHRLPRVGPLRLDGPARLRARPGGFDDPVAGGGCGGRCRPRGRCRGCSGGSSDPRRSTGRRSRAGSGSRACACPSRSGSRDSGRGPRCRRCPCAPRRSRSSCPDSAAAGGARRRSRKGRLRLSAHRRVRTSRLLGRSLDHPGPRLSTRCRVRQLLVGIIDAVYRWVPCRPPSPPASQPRVAAAPPAPAVTSANARSSPPRKRLLEERALSEISVEDLASGAGISRSTFYFYFPSKDAVLLTLVERMVEEAIEQPRAGLGEAGRGTAGGPARGVAGDLRGLRLPSRRDPRRRRAANATNAEARELWSEVMEGWVADVSAIIESERARGAAPPGLPARELAIALLQMNERVHFATFAGETPALEEDRVMDVLVDVWVRAIYGAVGNRLSRLAPAPRSESRPAAGAPSGHRPSPPR